MLLKYLRMYSKIFKKKLHKILILILIMTFSMSHHNIKRQFDKDINFKSTLKLSDLRNDNENKINKIKNKPKIEIKKKIPQLTLTEIDVVMQQLRNCFNPRAGTQISGNEMVKIFAKVDKNAYVRKDTIQIIDTNIIKSNPYYEAITESAIATLYNPLCTKLKLPLDKFEAWNELNITIDYSWVKKN